MHDEKIKQTREQDMLKRDPRQQLSAVIGTVVDAKLKAQAHDQDAAMEGIDGDVAHECPKPDMQAADTFVQAMKGAMHQRGKGNKGFPRAKKLAVLGRRPGANIKGCKGERQTRRDDSFQGETWKDWKREGQQRERKRWQKSCERRKAWREKMRSLRAPSPISQFMRLLDGADATDLSYILRFPELAQSFSQKLAVLGPKKCLGLCVFLQVDTRKHIFVHRYMCQKQQTLIVLSSNLNANWRATW